MSLSWKFHGTFTYKPYLGTVCQNLLEKLSKKSVLVVDVFFLPNFSFIFGNMSDSCRFHGPFMALSSCWFLLFFQTFSWHLHVRFMADSSRIHRGFMPVSFSPKKSKSCQIHVTFMAVSWQFHGTFTYKPYLGTVCQNLLEKVIQKVGVGCRCVFLPNFSFIFGNMSDSCRFHGPFMALSWRFLPSDFYCFFLKKIQTNNWIHLKNDRLASMSDSSQIHRGFMALSCHFHGTFLSASQLCRTHRGFMSLSWQFHGTFTCKPYLGTVCQNLLEKLSKKSVFLPNFSFIFGNMSDSCRFHGPFMALSWRFLPSDFYCFSKQFHGTCMADSWQIHGTFMALSWHFPGTFPFGHVWICHESAMNLPNLDETYMSDSCLFVSVYFCLFVVSVFLMLFSLMVFEVQVDQFFLGFSLIKI